MPQKLPINIREYGTGYEICYHRRSKHPFSVQYTSVGLIFLRWYDTFAEAYDVYSRGITYDVGTSLLPAEHDRMMRRTKARAVFWDQHVVPMRSKPMIARKQGERRWDVAFLDGDSHAAYAWTFTDAKEACDFHKRLYDDAEAMCAQDCWKVSIDTWWYWYRANSIDGDVVSLWTKLRRYI